MWGMLKCQNLKVGVRLSKGGANAMMQGHTTMHGHAWLYV